MITSMVILKFLPCSGVVFHLKKNYKNDYSCQTVQLLKIVPFLSYFAYCLRKAKLYPMKDFEISDPNLLFSTNGHSDPLTTMPVKVLGVF